MGNMGTWPDAPPAMPDGEAWDWAAHTERLRTQLERAQRRFKKYANTKRTERSFQVGEQVLLNLQPYVQNSVVSRPCAKLAFKFFGPFAITAKIGPLAYKLDLPPDSRVHPVFHVSQLKPFTPNYTPVFADLPIPDSRRGNASSNSGQKDGQARRPCCDSAQGAVG